MKNSYGTLVGKIGLSSQAEEGSANIYYGQIRSGKTYGATADIIEEVKLGRLVYATWPISLEAFDDRDSFWLTLRNLLFFNSMYFVIDSPKNLHYINAETGEVDGVKTFNPEIPSEYIAYLNKLNHCSLYIDEAWRVIDSYKGTSVSNDVRNLVLVTGHKFRTVNLITQRTTGIHVTARANAGRFYKFVKIATWPWLRFERREYQEMSGENVDETVEPISIKRYWASKKIFDAYNTHYYGELKPLHDIEYLSYELNGLERFKAFSGVFLRLLRLKPRQSEKNT